MTHTSTINKRRKKRKKVRRFIVISLFACIGIFLLSIAWIQYGNNFKEYFKTKVFSKNLANIETSFNLDSISQYQYGKIGNSILLCNKEGAKRINTDGEDEWSLNLSTNNPIISINGRYILVGSQGGREVNLLLNSNIIINRKTDDPIISVKVNKSGSFVLVTGERGYKSQVIVYNNKGEEEYKVHTVNNYVTDVDLSEDNKILAISTLDTGKGQVSGGLMFYRLDSKSDKRAVAAIENENSLISNINFCDDGNLIVVSDNKIMQFSKKGDKKWTVDFGEKVLTYYDIEKSSKDNMIALAFRDKKDGLGGANIIETYSSKGIKQTEIKTEAQISRLRIHNGYVACSQERDIFVYDKKGKEYLKKSVNRDIKDIVLFGDKGGVAVFSRSGADVIRFK